MVGFSYIVSRDFRAPTYMYLGQKLVYFPGVACRRSPKRLEKFTYTFSFPLSHSHPSHPSKEVKVGKRIDVDFHFSVKKKVSMVSTKMDLENPLNGKSSFTKGILRVDQCTL